MFLKKYLILSITLLLFIGCSKTEESSTVKIAKKDIPKKIIMLFVTQPHCPSCDELEKSMQLKAPSKLIKNYFEVKKVNIGEKLPDGLTPPNGTPTVYFLGYKDELLVEPMLGEKDEVGLMMFLEDALLEFKNLYSVDLQKKEEKKSETDISNISN